MGASSSNLGNSVDDNAMILSFTCLPGLDDFLGRPLFSAQIDDGRFLGKADFLDELVQLQVDGHRDTFLDRTQRTGVDESHRRRKDQSLPLLFLLLGEI